MFSNLKNPICIYHGNCPDGFGSAWSIWYSKYGKEFEFYPGVYSNPPPNVTNRDVFLVDFSYKKEVIEEMSKTAESITLIDHHVSAIENLKDVNYITKFTNMNKSGCILTWEYFNKDCPIPEFLKYIQDRDLWKFELPYSKEITTAILSYEYDFETWLELSRKNIDILILEGSALYRKHIKDIKELVRNNKRRINILEYNVPIANLPYCYASDACDIMNENEEFACSYFIRNDDKVCFSLRSKNGSDVDVSKIAISFGGGGHKHASGFEISLNDKDNLILKQLFNR